MNTQTVTAPGTPSLVSDDVAVVSATGRSVRLVPLTGRRDLAVWRQRDETSAHYEHIAAL